MSQWQDIRTAPKDGSWLILFCDFEDGKEYRIGRWVADHRLPSRHGDYGPFVWATVQGNPHVGSIAEKVPTHWMPLPAPPSAVPHHEQDAQV